MSPRSYSNASVQVVTGLEALLATEGVLGPVYAPADIIALESDVLPKYLSFFNTLAVDRVILAPQAAVVTCGPLASSIVDAVIDRLPSAVVRGFEPSEAAILAAAERTSSLPATVDFEVLKSLPSKQPDAAYTHALIVHPISAAKMRLQLVREAARLLVPAGQLLFALPLRGSFPEIVDMLREFSLKHDTPSFGEAIEVGAHSRPTPETFTEDLERLGFVDVSVDVELLSVAFETGKDFIAHPLFRLVVVPELACMIGGSNAETLGAAIDYAKAAIVKYWSEGQFDLTVNIGCASARKP